jgi:exodeoxyribonuclease VII large subunit
MADQLGFTISEKEEDIDADNFVKEEPKPLTVSELNGLIRGSIEGQFRKVWLRGEISNFKPHSSGHFYFSLKDEGSQISAIMFRGQNSRLKFTPENGMEVFVHGKVTVYEPRGQYSINCESMEPVGAGALQKAFEQLKAKLEKEGLFSPARKRPLPKFPRHIGLVTSPTGAAIKDILNVLRRRYKGAQITLAPAVVQGDAAAASIVAALEMINKLQDVDVLIVGRGGGSIEDMWCFNDERVARAIVASRIPVISAVGHEIDFTIADFVADLRAPTPSAAAELVCKNAGDLVEQLRLSEKRLVQSLRVVIDNLRREVRTLTSRLVDPQRYLQDLILRADELTTRLENGVFRYLEIRRNEVELALQKIGTPLEKIVRLHKRLENFSMRVHSAFERKRQKLQIRFRESVGRLETLSPLKVLDRGFSVVMKKDKIMTSTASLKVGDEVKIQLAQGQALAEVKKLLPNEKTGGQNGL